MKLRKTLLVALVSLVLCGSAPATPYGGSAAVYNDPEVCKQFEKMWAADQNGTMRDGTWEYGFKIDYINGKIVCGQLVMGDQPLRVLIPCDANTIAIAHVHPNSGVSTPSQVDMDGKYPDYVVSRDGLCVTDPKTHTYRKIKNFADQFNPNPPVKKHKKSS